MILGCWPHPLWACEFTGQNLEIHSAIAILGAYSVIFLLYSVWTCNILANSLLFVCFNKFFYFDNSGEHYKLVLKIKYHKNEKIKQVMHLS